MIDKRLVYKTPLRLLCMFVGLFFFIPTSWAQKQKIQNRPYADYRHFNWGFHVGMHVQDLVIDNAGIMPPGAPADAPLLYASMPAYSPGFSVGVIANYSPVLNLDFRLLPTLHFGERPLVYSDANGFTKRINVRSNILELPFLVKYSSVRFNDHRPYVLAGPYASFQLGQKNTDPINFKLLDAGFSIGVGCDIYLRYFKLSPELRFSFGMMDVLQSNRPQLQDDHRIRYTQFVSRMQSRMILLTFNFE